jgi:hypothetical protein
MVGYGIAAENVPDSLDTVSTLPARRKSPGRSHKIQATPGDPIL